MPSPRILAHRGASGYALENSIEAFREARQRGADGVELDIHTSRTGRLIVHHDPAIPGVGRIARLSDPELDRVRLANGEPVPTLDAALVALAGLEVWIEIKSLPPGSDAALLRTIDESPSPDRCAVHGFDHRLVARLAATRPNLRCGILSTTYPSDPLSLLRNAHAGTLWQEAEHIDGALVEAVHQGGCEVIAWTVNDVDQARALGAMGVDALCGNFPDRIRLH